MSDLVRIFKQYHTSAKRELRKIGCNSYFFEDLYQESFIIFMKMQEDEGKKINYPYTYIIRICKSLWIKECKRKQIYELKADLDEYQYQASEEDYEKIKLLKSCQKKLSVICQEILNLYYDGLSEDEICYKLGYTDRRVVSNKKNYCKERLRYIIINDPKFKELNG